MKYLTNKTLILIFFLALFLRVYKLGTFPIGFHADEVRVGWNARSILETGKDDWGIRLPLYYNTFGDYRPTGILYLTVPSVAVWGNSEFATRFPSALLGAATVFPLFGFVKLLTKNRNLALLSSFFLSILSWHLLPSRATSEVIVSLFLFITSTYFYEKAKADKDKKFIFLAFGFTLIGYFFYHSIRLLAPIYFLTFLLIDKNILKKIQLIKPMKTGVVLLFFVTLILSLTSGGQGRLSQVSLVKDKDVQTKVLGLKTESISRINKLFENPIQIYIQSSIQEYTTYLSPQFLIGESPLPARYKIQGIGLLSIPLFLLLGIGIIGVIQKKYSSIPLVLMLLSPLPAMITREDSPNLHRVFFMIPFVIMLTAYGAHYLYKKRPILTPILAIWIVFAMINTWMRYFSIGSLQIYQYRSPGAKEVSLYLKEVKNLYPTIYVTNDPDSLYPWFAFFTNRFPEEFNQLALKRKEGIWQYENIVWTQNKCPTGVAFDEAKKENKKVLVINAGECSDTGFEREHPSAHIIKKFDYFPGKIAYSVWEYEPKN